MYYTIYRHVYAGLQELGLPGVGIFANSWGRTSFIAGMLWKLIARGCLWRLVVLSGFRVGGILCLQTQPWKPPWTCEDSLDSFCILIGS